MPPIFTKKIVIILSIISFFSSLFLPIDINDTYRVTFGRIIAYAMGNAAGMILFPLFIVWIYSLVLRIKKTKLSSNDFWKAFFIVWIIFAFLNISGRLFFN